MITYEWHLFLNRNPSTDDNEKSHRNSILKNNSLTAQAKDTVHYYSPTEWMWSSRKDWNIHWIISLNLNRRVRDKMCLNKMRAKALHLRFSVFQFVMVSCNKWLTVVLRVIHHHQNPLESTRKYRFLDLSID
jgi:hypothetical protein